APGPLENLHRAPAGTGGVNDQLPPCCDMVAHRGDLFCGHIRPDEIELVPHAVEGTVADQDECEVVVRLGTARHLADRFEQMRARSLLASEHVDVRPGSAAVKIRCRSLAAAVKRCS